MASTPSLEQARLGDPEAIAQVIQYLLPDQHTIVHAQLKQDYLEIILESPTVPDRASSVDFINQAMRKIGAKSITTVLVQGRELGKANVEWKECRDFTQESENNKKKSFPKINIKWPVWFPYPSSWLRAIALLLWFGIVVEFFRFWGVVAGDIAAAISEDDRLYLMAVGVSFLGAIFVFSLGHHLILSIFKKSKSKTWIPGGRSWWEGVVATIVLFLSLAIVLILMLPFLPGENCHYFGNFSNSCYYQYQDEIESWNLIAAGVWIISILYLYQAELLLRTHISAQKVLKFIAIATISCVTISSIYAFSRHIEYIGSVVSSFADRTPPVAPAETVEPTKSEAIAPSQAEPEPVNLALSKPIKTTEKPESAIAPDPFSGAVKKATIASNLAQTADSEEDWNIVAKNWEAATELMGQVPPESDNYEIARDRVIQYQKNFDYSRTMATKVSATN